MFQPGNFHAAVKAFKDGMSIRKAAKSNKIPFETLRKHVQGIHESKKRGPKTYLTPDQEEELEEAILYLDNMGAGISTYDLRCLAMDVANSEEGSKQFKNGLPSRNWARGFIKRHNLSARRPVNTSTSRLQMETEEVKKDFYDNLKKIIDELTAQGLTPSQIFNTDETGLCFVTKSGRVVSLKGKKKVFVHKIGERGQNTTVVATVNATGSISLPPTVIFRGKLLSSDVVLSDAPEGTVFATSPRSFIDGELFEEFFIRFLNSIPPARPVLLLLDGHGSHISLRVIRMAKGSNVHILCLPPHTTHLYQPLDKSVFGILKKEFAAAESALMRRSGAAKIGKQHFLKLLKTAWMKTLTPSNITAGFRACGVWPVDPTQVILPCQSVPRVPSEVRLDIYFKFQCFDNISSMEIYPCHGSILACYRNLQAKLMNQNPIQEMCRSQRNGQRNHPIMELYVQNFYIYSQSLM